MTLTARSVIASTLLGTIPSRLPGRLLVALAAEFDISAGTARVALSRMTDRGELRNADGVYHLDGPLLERQERQLETRVTPARHWDGTWEMWVVRSGSRSAAERSEVRRALEVLGMAELREGTWLRPDNLDPERLPRRRACVAAAADRLRVEPDEPHGLVAGLWPLDRWSGESRRLAAEMVRVTGRLRDDDHSALVPGFELSAAVLRHFLADPRLPDGLWPPGWPAAELRSAYDDYDTAYREVLRAFFRAVR